jgi:dTDP-4-dehydrorhamnose 3,5-epimerase-like enzyme
VNPTIPGVRTIVLKEDPETFDWYHADSLVQYGLPDLPHQDEIELQKGEIRGVHLYADPWPTQVYRAVRGSVIIIIVDLRLPDGGIYRGWHPNVAKVLLSAKDDQVMLCIPPGCAQGIQAVEARSLVRRLSTFPLPAGAPLGIHWNDPMFDNLWDPKLNVVTQVAEAKLPSFGDIPRTLFLKAS